MRFILFTLILAGISTSAFAATDSLIIQGRILNLNGRLYRQAPAITFSRNNILQPQSELSKQAPLAADGSFRVSLPMLFTKEEIYLDYSGKAFTTFLGSPGTVEITFDGDSLAKGKRLFYFAGENAGANNQYHIYLAEENKRLAANPALGSRFYDTFWEKSANEVQGAAAKRAELKVSALSKVGSAGVVDPALRQWIQSVANDEMLQNLYEYALSNGYALGTDLLDSLKRLSVSPLTAQRVTLASRFGTFGDRMVEEKRYANPGRSSSLPVRRMATLIRNNATELTSEEKTRLDEIAIKGVAEKSELDFLNKLFAKNETVLNLLFGYERESRSYGELYDSTAREFLKARFLPKNFYKYTYRQQIVLSKHIQSTLTIPQFAQSLDEIVRIEVKDSADIKKMIDFRSISSEPVETLPGYFMSASNERGTAWANRILDKYKGKTIYLVKWNFEDARSREEMEFMTALQAQLPRDIVFIYFHLPADDAFVSGDLVKQYIVRHRLKGTHLFLNSGQTMDLLFKLNPIEPGTFAVIKPNGKFFSKNAPGPRAMEKTVQVIMEAGSK
ncbi:hypothetical protein [Dyadobacter psychrotolerans]|uniref:Thioredoxin domain-containing protein n=1 Tax=Dyadobacter psychrotolerans TaxID=2541721 RepID=A0A4R5DUP8_9BACT|nr:hypothetical protein [Dyadobacter psychrotolerans]TDE18222.1 hypothetical protein E0F88_01370 [Dyadobacter psychrotolerans]